ncbi:MAG: hypothetical protein ABSF32_11375 [Ignavibacteria bacterium]
MRYIFIAILIYIIYIFLKYVIKIFFFTPGMIFNGTILKTIVL